MDLLARVAGQLYVIGFLMILIVVALVLTLESWQQRQERKNDALIFKVAEEARRDFS